MSNDRRTAVRHTRQMKVPCSAQRIVEDGPWEVTVVIVAPTAVRLSSSLPFRIGMHVSVDLPDEHGKLLPRLLRLTMVRPQADRADAIMDGTLFKALEPAEVETARARIGAGSARGIPPSRSSGGWKTSCKHVRVRHEGPWLVTMQNVSQTGIGLVTDRAFEAGTFLQVELPSIKRKHLKPRLVRVTHSKPQPNAEWAIGCVFLRELTEEELQALL